MERLHSELVLNEVKKYAESIAEVQSIVHRLFIEVHLI